MDMKENIANLNPNAHEFVPLEVKAGACQKSVDYLCKMTGLETLLSLVQRQDHKGFAGASLNAPIHHHYPHHVRSSLDKASTSSVASSEPTLQQTAAFQQSLFVAEESEDESEMFENRVRAKISGVRSQVSGVQRYSHALLYITDCGTPMRTAKLTSYEHFNEGLVQIFGNHIPAALSHVHHEFYYHLIQDKLFYRVQLSFSFDDGKNMVRFDSRYGFTDALLNVYEKFSYMLESWGYTLLDGNVHPVRPESWFGTKAPVLELVGKERLVYSKQELLSIAAIQSMKGDYEDVVNAATILNFPDSLRTDHVSFVSRNVLTEEDIHHKKKVTEKIGHTWHRRHHRRHNNNHNHNVVGKKEDVVVVKKLAPGERKRSEPVPIKMSEEVVEVKRAASLQVPSSSRGHNFVDIDRDDLSEQICIVEKDKDVVKVVTKKNRRRTRRNKSNKSNEKHAEEDSSGSSSDEHASKEAQNSQKESKSEESAQKVGKNVQKEAEIGDEQPKVDEKGEIAEIKVKSKRRRRRRGKKHAAAKSSEEDSSSLASSGDNEKKETDVKVEADKDKEVAAEDKDKEESETVQKAKRHRSRRGKRGGKRNSLSNDDASASANATATPTPNPNPVVEEKVEEIVEEKVIEFVH